MADEETQRKWDEWRERRDACRAGTHSDLCPDKICPVKKKWSEAMWAEFRQRRKERGIVEGRPFAPGPDERRAGAGGFAGLLPAGGWRSTRVVAPLAAAIKAKLLDDPATADYLLDPQWDHTLTAWSWTEAQVMLVRGRLDEIAMEMADAETATEDELIEQLSKTKRRRKTSLMRRDSLLRTLDVLEKRAAGLRRELGLTPLSRARLGADVARGKGIDLALLMEEFWKRQGESAEGGEPRQPAPAIPAWPERPPGTR